MVHVANLEDETTKIPVVLSDEDAQLLTKLMIRQWLENGDERRDSPDKRGFRTDLDL